MVMSHHITDHARPGVLVMCSGELLAVGLTSMLNRILFSWSDDLLTDNPSISHSSLSRSAEESVYCCGHEMEQFSG